LRRILSITAVAATLFVGAPVFAGNEIGILTGASIPRGQTTEDGVYGQKTGWEAGVFFLRDLNRTLDVRVDLSHRQLPNEVEIKGVSPMKITELALNAKIRTCDKQSVKPYLLAGVGVAHLNVLVDLEREEVHYTSSSTELAIHAGAGLDLDLSGKVDLFVEAMVWESYYVSLLPLRGGLRLAL
jgi:opacity protein-like surface antigen